MDTFVELRCQPNIKYTYIWHHTQHTQSHKVSAFSAFDSQAHPFERYNIFLVSSAHYWLTKIATKYDSHRLVYISVVYIWCVCVCVSAQSCRHHRWQTLECINHALWHKSTRWVFPYALYRSINLTQIDANGVCVFAMKQQPSRCIFGGRTETKKQKTKKNVTI